jgi:uncharacterized membrane protein YqjE
VSSTPPGRRGAEQPHNIAAAIAEVSERASLLVREEIELAKAEVSEKATKLIKGAIVGVVAGIFFMAALVFALVGCAWLLYYFLPGNNFTYFWGFFAMAVILVVLGTLAGLVAARAVKKASPPVPNMAIEEARKIRDAVSAPTAGATSSAPPVGAAVPSEAPVADAASFADGAGDVAQPPIADSDGDSPASFDNDEVAESVQPTVVTEAIIAETPPSSDFEAASESQFSVDVDAPVDSPADLPDPSTAETED